MHTHQMATYRNGNGHRNGKMGTSITFGKQSYAIPKCNVMHKTLLQRLRAYSPGMFQLHVVCDFANHAASMIYYILNATKL